MDDRAFFDHLYQMWVKTTGAENTYWDYEKRAVGHVISSVREDGERGSIGSFFNEGDADFVTAIHGCFPDLVRRLNEALDEADRADFDRDSRECRIAELEVALAEELASVAALQAELEMLKEDLEGFIAR